MKKTIWSLAALMMLMAAPMMTSCSNELDAVVPTEEVKSNVVTITIAPPAAETRVAVNGSLKITGWEDGANADVVTLYKMAYTGGGAEGTPASTLTGAGVTFTCIDASNGTFSGDLGENNIDDYTLAVYGATAKLEDINGSNYVVLLPKTMCAEELKDVVIMAAMKDNEGNYTMEVVNNVLKIKNGSAADVEVAWSQEQKYYEGDIHFFTPLSGWIFDDVAYDWIWTGAKVYPGTLPNYTGWEKAEKFTLKAGVDSYVNMGLCGNSYEKWGLAKEDGTEILEKKQMTGRANGVKGKLYNAGTVGAAPATTGTAKAIINGSEVDVHWSQLWAGGPKFADRNVEGSVLGMMTFAEATEEPFIWGANWCTPSKEDMEELVKAASGTGSTKLTCEYVEVGGTYGFRFTGKEAGYTENSVFFPMNGNSTRGDRGYMTSTAIGEDYCFFIDLYNNSGTWMSYFDDEHWQDDYAYVRPVLK